MHGTHRLRNLSWVALGTIYPMFGVQRRQESEGFKFTHRWNTSPQLAAESDAGLPQNPSKLILASDRSEPAYGTPITQLFPQLSVMSSVLLPLAL